MKPVPYADYKQFLKVTKGKKIFFTPIPPNKGESYLIVEDVLDNGFIVSPDYLWIDDSIMKDDGMSYRAGFGFYYVEGDES